MGTHPETAFRLGHAETQRSKVVVEEKKAEEIKKSLEDKKFKCDVCGFSTDIKIALLGHMRKHNKKE
jgi:hypothetical protein